MARISLVVAAAKNGVIGVNGDLPWRLKTDLQLFKKNTLGKPVIMGRKTWESLPFKPLPKRMNIVVTRSPGYFAEGAIVVGDLGAAFDEAHMRADMDDVDEVCVIGGAQIYAATREVADRIYLTEVDAEPQGDAHLDPFDPDIWQEVHSEAYPAGPDDDHAFTFKVLERSTSAMND
ncbi:dihydrofolate reductase [Hyphobacterium sp. HN65]|uniref:Dihydrofolate reductase n=1 Tax=Hyphobacterium lacteum TaxID=3116575 RepID=A0ABU7LQU0_9PROT|nr:dihydrofolate reductase [Hyphobacterium sp. HN65]MEE2526281.1 dihydrofolate reductase [Hyphobacterium sp. HN65]